MQDNVFHPRQQSRCGEAYRKREGSVTNEGRYEGVYSAHSSPRRARNTPISLFRLSMPRRPALGKPVTGK